MIEWKKLTRGTYRLRFNYYEADVWKIGGKGWKCVIWETIYENEKITGLDVFKAKSYFDTLDMACEYAEKEMGI